MKYLQMSSFNYQKFDLYPGIPLLKAQAKNGSLKAAHSAFDAISEHTAVSWTSLISAYCRQGLFRESFVLFQKMLLSNVVPDNVTFIVLLKACSSLLDVDLGREIHFLISESGLDCNVFVGNSLIDMYMKCGNADGARNLFDKMHAHLIVDVVSWTSLVSGYAAVGLGNVSLFLFQQMIMEGIQPNEITFMSVFKACGSMPSLESGKKAHIHFLNRGDPPALNVGNALLDMYSKHGHVEHAHHTFSLMQEKDVVSWTSLMSGYVRQNLHEESICFFNQMHQEGMLADNAALATAIQACIGIILVENGKQFSSYLVTRIDKPDAFLVSSLIDMYAECGNLSLARELFDETQESTLNTVVWNTMIATYVSHAHWGRARQLLLDMHEKCFLPDHITFLTFLKPCPNKAFQKHLHVQITGVGCISDVSVHNALIDMQISSGCSQHANVLFDRMHDHDMVSRSTVISGFENLKNFQEAHGIFERMIRECIQPNQITFPRILNLCASVAILEYGMSVHSFIIECSSDIDIYIKSALIDMYVKCGSLVEARWIFDKIEGQNVVTWNSIVGGYALQGLVFDAIMLFCQMQEEIVPDLITFIMLLYACNHSGLVSGVLIFIRLMSSSFGHTPTGDHFACVIDVLGRVGHLCMSLEALEHLPIQPDVEMWMSLFGACSNHGCACLAECVFNQILELGA